MKIADSFTKIFGNKQKILVVMARPDDNVIICGGTVARLVDEGKKLKARAEKDKIIIEKED